MNQDFYNIFKHKLKDASQPYPQGLWDKIQPEVPKYTKGNRKKGGWIWLSAFALLFISATVWTQLDKPNRINTEEASLMKNASNENPSIALNTSSSIQLIETPIKSSEINENELKTSLILANSSISKTIDNQASSIKEKEVRDQTSVPLEIETNTSKEPLFNLNNSIINSTGEIIYTSQTTQPISTNSIESSTSQGSEEKENRSTRPISLLSPTQRTLGNIQETMIAMQPDPSCYSFSNRHQSTYSADVYVGYGYGLRPMNSRDENVSAYIDARKATESYRYLFTAGVRLNMMMNNGLAFRGGLHYTQIGEKFDYTDSSSIRIITIIDTTFVGGDTIVNPPQQVIQPGTVVKKINNRYHSLDIPLLVGYDVPLGRMHASLSAGAVINISAWQRGQFLDPSLEPANIDVDETDEYYPAYKTTLGVGAYLSASLAVPVSKDIWFFGEPYILHRFDPVTFDEYSIKQGNTNFGINVGLKLKL